jgi:homoserine dehydrogenase
MQLLLIGFGTVGQGLSELLLDKRQELIARHGFDWKVCGIADTLKGSVYDPAGIDLAEAIARVEREESLSEWPAGGCDWDAPRMIAEAEADAMVELTYTDIETGQPATDHIRAALDRGLHVSTTNKGPVTLHYYQSALGEAQDLGYAEAVPDADVLGYDALAKVTILANVVFGADLAPKDSPCQGITHISPDDISSARDDGKRYKLIGHVWREGDEIRGSVSPQLVELSHPLAGVGGATNAMAIRTDTLGEITIVGPGAGRRETGFSLLNDLLTMWRRS